MKLDTQFNPLPQINSEISKRDKTLEKIAAATELKLEETSSRTISNMMQSNISTASQGLMNANEGISMMQIAGGTLTSLSEQTQKLNDLSVRHNNDALNESQKEVLQDEFNRTLESMQDSIDSSSFNGKSLFGSNSTFTLGEESISTTISELATSSLSIESLYTIEMYRESLTQASSDIASTTNALVSATDRLLNQITEISAAKSQIADTDVANAVKDFQQSDLKLDMSQIAIAHQNDILRQNVTRLLG
ncbi:MAG: flagellin [Sulfuricurvum sp.]|uniref:flagellin n=1 Tax=Sulfuricurvum sp. TaxID=2025608 RepID=UPI002727DAC5|nr:flagellin [Sulfuricurvum sp.]MDO9056115.1 flagellin [Sulfuricurvum sp.]